MARGFRGRGRDWGRPHEGQATAQGYPGSSGHSPRHCLWEPGCKSVAKGSHSRHLRGDMLATTWDTQQVLALRLASPELSLWNFLQSYPPSDLQVSLSPYFKAPSYFLLLKVFYTKSFWMTLNQKVPETSVHIIDCMVETASWQPVQATLQELQQDATGSVTLVWCRGITHVAKRVKLRHCLPDTLGGESVFCTHQGLCEKITCF